MKKTLQEVIEETVAMGAYNSIFDSHCSGWVNDIKQMHAKFKVQESVSKLDKEKLRMFLEFKIKFLQEELDEMKKAFEEGGENAADDTVDALIDLCVVSLDTLGAFNIDADLAWNRVYEKNMQKEIGTNAKRPNPLGLPDLVKPEGWTPPSHKDNVGLFGKVFD